MSSRNILVRLFSAVWGGINGLRKLLHLLLLLFIFMLFFGVMSGEPPHVLPRNAALVIQPVGALVEQLAGDPYERAIAELMGESQPQTLVQDIVDALEAARDDDRIGAVHFELSSLTSAGVDKLERVSEAIADFQTSGKPVIASADFYSQQGYFIAAHADEVYLNPEGIVFLQGYGTYRTFYKDAIDLLRIDWNVFRVGSHKSFAEPYTRMDMSPEDRESRIRLLDHLWGAYQERVVEARGLDAAAIDDYAQNLVAHTEAAGGDMALAARDRGLVDELLSRTELRNVMIGHVGPDDEDESTYSGVWMYEYLNQLRLRSVGQAEESNVAVIVAAGSIRDGDQPPGTIGGDSTAALLKRALDDESVKAVVLRVDSNGGSAFASEVIAEEVRALQAAGKPVVASMGSMAASGGYWISMDADRIYASPTTVTGSIGIVGMFPTFQRTMATVGIGTDGVGTTPWSGQLRPDREMNAQTKALFQAVIDDGYRDFITGVSRGRDLDVDFVDQIGQGQVWSGEEALANGLVDELGGLDEAITGAAELAGLDSFGEKLIEKQISPTEQLILDLLTMFVRVGIDPAPFAAKPTLVETFANRFEALLADVAQFNDPMARYAYCFCTID